MNSLQVNALIQFLKFKIQPQKVYLLFCFKLKVQRNFSAEFLVDYTYYAFFLNLYGTVYLLKLFYFSNVTPFIMHFSSCILIVIGESQIWQFLPKYKKNIQFYGKKPTGYLNLRSASSRCIFPWCSNGT